MEVKTGSTKEVLWKVMCMQSVRTVFGEIGCRSTNRAPPERHDRCFVCLTKRTVVTTDGSDNWIPTDVKTRRQCRTRAVFWERLQRGSDC